MALEHARRADVDVVLLQRGEAGDGVMTSANQEWNRKVINVQSY